MPIIKNKLQQLTAPNLSGQLPDPWADFREIEILELNWAQTYRHSLGKYSRFFLELENGRFLATRCPSCCTTWTPPRPVCPNDLSITEWVELKGTGHVVSFSVLHYAPTMAADLKTPYVLAYVKLDGADTLFAHLLQNYGDLSCIQHGLPVQIVYHDGPVGHPILLISFEPT